MSALLSQPTRLLQFMTGTLYAQRYTAKRSSSLMNVYRTAACVIQSLVCVAATVKVSCGQCLSHPSS